MATLKKRKKVLAITSKAYLVKALEGLRIDLSNHVYYMGEAQKDWPEIVNETQKQELKDLRNISKRVERLEDRVRNATAFIV